MVIQKSLRCLLLAGSTLTPCVALAQEAPRDPNEIIVTATRRADAVQDVPFNIAAVTGEALQEQRTLELSDIAATVPGVYIVDAGQRQGNQIVFRGLNADPLSSGDGDNSGGGTVAVYLGEIPLYVDLRAIDVERVEFLVGPQGTLYGAGTLGGAIRYIPNRPQFDAVTGEVRADLYKYDHGDGISTDTGMTINFPLSSTLAFRGSIDLLNDRGFIDYPFVVTQLGQVNPNDFSAGNLRRYEDVNWVETVSGRAALRWQPVEAVDLNLTYYYQDQATGGRQISHRNLSESPLLDSNGDLVDFPVEVGEYESALRVLEPNRRKNQLLALEAAIDLGFAELTSATGWSKFNDRGNRDQTDLLITLEYSYEAFPNFVSRTLEVGNEETWTQEARLVSTHDGPFNWIVGGFYNNQEGYSRSLEFTPGLDVYYGTDYPENIEYVQDVMFKLKEYAAYGELGFEITPAWNVTAGGRYYKYDYTTASAFDLPLLDIAFGGRAPDAPFELDFEESAQERDGFLWKLNTSYEFNPDALVYATVSKGFRIGSGNGIAACPPGFDPTAPGNGQTLCALPDEFQYGPDKTTNYELGFKTQWMNRRLTLNGSVFFIDWQDPQLASTTQAGNLPITINGDGAETKGVELSAAFRVTPELTISGNYSFVDAKLTATTADLISYTEGPGFPSLYEDGLPGDRLPGSPRHKGNLFIDYERPLSADTSIGFTYKMTAQSNVLTRTGGRQGITLDGFALHGAALTFDYRGLSTQLYVDNIFDKYAETGVRSSPPFRQVVYNDGGDPVYVRSFGTFVAAPRSVGIRSVLKF